MTDAAIEYEACERQILYLRVTGIMRDDFEDPVLERMDWLWPQMTAVEQEQARARVRSFTGDVGTPLLDRTVQPGAQGLPREDAA